MTDVDQRLPERFRSRLSVNARGCWIWTGAKNGNGYGSYVTKTTRPVTTVLAHRFSWSVLRGALPELLDHLCHERACVNPDHMRAATRKQNSENLAGPRRDNASGIRGVRWHDGSWQIRVRHHGELHEKSGFQTAEDAEVAAIALRQHLFGSSNEWKEWSA